MTWVVVILFFSLVAARAPAADEFVSATNALEQAAACLENIQGLITNLTALEQAARDADERIRADCLRNQINSLVGLERIITPTRARLQALVAQGSRESAVDELERISTVRLRADKVSQAAAACSATDAKQPAPPPSVSPERKQVTPIPRERPPWLRPRNPRPRNEATCLHQQGLAVLLATALGLPPRDGPACIAELTKREIEPLGGWQPADCATVADLHVVAALALKLTVADPDTGADYAQALRNEGLPVDSILPAVGDWDAPPLLLEAEARAFFKSGFAAPLPTSRHYMPR